MGEYRSATDYGVNRAIDRTLRAFTFGDLDAMVRSAGLLRRARLLSIAKETVRQAKSDWPHILKDAPDGVQRKVSERLSGGVALTQD